MALGLSQLKQKEHKYGLSLHTMQNYATQKYFQKKEVQTNFKIANVYDEIPPYCQSLLFKVLKQTSIHP